jgi:hypothetical protein
MLVERTATEIIIRISSSVDTEELQRLLNYFSYREATANSKAKQAHVDKLAKLVKKNRHVSSFLGKISHNALKNNRRRRKKVGVGS